MRKTNVGTESVRKPVDNFPSSFLGHHGQEGLCEVRVDRWIANDLVPKDHQTQVVDIVDAILLHVDSILDRCTWTINYLFNYICISTDNKLFNLKMYVHNHGPRRLV